MCFVCSVFLIMSLVTVANTNLPVTVMCLRPSPITMTVTVAPTSVGLPALSQHDVVLPPQLILRDTKRDVT